MTQLLYRAVRPWLFRQDAEDAHDFVLAWAARSAKHPALLSLTHGLYAPPDRSSLHCKVFGIDFRSPIGLAAGLDKNGVAVDFWNALGFGFVEVGTVTPGEGQPGNDKPRMARLVPDQALINRMGFNNRGASALATSLHARHSAIVVGGNIGKAKITPLERAADDYAEALEPIWPEVDYVVVNVSSPNTPGLRDLQSVEALRPLLERVLAEDARLAQSHQAEKKPVLLKLAPDLADEDLDSVCDLAMDLGLAGLIATNTTIRKEGLSAPIPIEGGLSGAPLRARALECTRRLRRRTRGEMPIVGVGGIRTAEDAYERIRAGASLIQVYTALVYEGPGLVSTLAEGIASYLDRDGFGSVSEAVGVDVDR